LLKSLEPRRAIDILQVSGPTVEGGVIEVPVEAQLEGRDGRMGLRFSVDAAANMSARLGCSHPNRGIPTTSMKWIRAAAAC
jgi:hypothetical protein